MLPLLISGLYNATFRRQRPDTISAQFSTRRPGIVVRTDLFTRHVFPKGATSGPKSSRPGSMSSLTWRRWVFAGSRTCDETYSQLSTCRPRNPRYSALRSSSIHHDALVFEKTAISDTGNGVNDSTESMLGGTKSPFFRTSHDTWVFRNLAVRNDQILPSRC